MIPTKAKPIFQHSKNSILLILKSLFSASSLSPPQCLKKSNHSDPFSGVIQNNDLLHRAPNGNLLVLELIDNGSMKPDFKLYSELFNMCTAQRNLATGQMVLSHFLRSKFQHHVYLQNAGINMCGKCQDLKLARKVFDDMRDRNIISYNMLIGGYSHINKFKEVLGLFIDLMKMGLQPNEIIFSSSLKAAAGLHTDALGSGIHVTCIKYGFDNNVCVGSALVNMYGKTGSIEDAEKVFHRLVEMNVVSWTSMINAYGHHGLNHEAIDLFQEMCAVGLQPNEVTLLSAVNSSAGMQSNTVGRKIHGTSIKYGCQKNVYVANALLNMYGMTGSIEDAGKVFHLLVEKDVFSWNSMINAYGHNGFNQEAIDLFQEMCVVGLQPNEVTLSRVVNSAVGMRSDAVGRKIHGTCIKYGCLMNVFVGTALVDMYGKAGSIRDAEKILLRMVKKNIVSWSSMINAYEHCGLNQEAIDLFEEMIATK